MSLPLITNITPIFGARVLLLIKMYDSDFNEFDGLDFALFLRNVPNQHHERNLDQACTHDLSYMLVDLGFVHDSN